MTPGTVRGMSAQALWHCEQLGQGHQTELRVRAVRSVNAGESPERAVRTLGFARPRIYGWIARYREGGVEGFG